MLLHAGLFRDARVAQDMRRAYMSAPAPAAQRRRRVLLAVALAIALAVAGVGYLIYRAVCRRHEQNGAKESPGG